MQEIPLPERILLSKGRILVIIQIGRALRFLGAYTNIIGLNPIKGVPVLPVRQEDILREAIESTNIKGDRIRVCHGFLL